MIKYKITREITEMTNLKEGIVEANGVGDMFTADIDIDQWGSRIQCHGHSSAEAIALRDAVMKALGFMYGEL